MGVAGKSGPLELPKATIVPSGNWPTSTNSSAPEPPKNVAATGVAFSFATTYALGQVARRYYAGGRTMNTQMLKDAYTSMVGQARGLQAQYMPQIEQQAKTVDLGKVVQMVRAS